MNKLDKIIVLVLALLSAFFAMTALMYLGYLIADWIRT